MKYLALIVIPAVAVLSGCAPTEPHASLNGMACKPVGYSWAIRGYMMAPNGQIC